MLDLYKCVVCGETGFSHIKMALMDSTNRVSLCHGCNKGMAYLKNNPKLLRKATLYVERYNKC